jgi:hypothetical protein
MKIQLAVPSFTGDIPLKVISRLMHLDKPKGSTVIFSYSVRVAIDRARNAMARQCVDNKNDYLFFCDSDQIIPKNLLTTLVSLDKDVIGTPICSRSGVHELAVYDLDYNRLNQFTGLQEVGGIGMGATLIKRHVLEEVFKSYSCPFQFDSMIETKDGKESLVEFSEDICFCRRARELGFKIFCTDQVAPVYHLGDPTMFYYEAGEYKRI